MSLMSDRAKLQAKADDSEVDLLRAALAESQERYNRYSLSIERRIQALEKAVNEQNKEINRNIHEAIKDGALKSIAPIEDVILKDLRCIITDMQSDLETTTSKYKNITYQVNHNAKITWGLVAVFALFLVFIGYQLGQIKTSTEYIYTVDNKVDNGLYDKNGYSVLEDSKGAK